MEEVVLLVQLARAAGGQRKLDVIRDAGAEAAVDYSEPDWTERVRELTAGRGAEVVFDGAGGRLGRAAFEVTASGGRFSAHGMSDGGFAGIDAAEAHAALEARTAVGHPVRGEPAKG